MGAKHLVKHLLKGGDHDHSLLKRWGHHNEWLSLLPLVEDDDCLDLVAQEIPHWSEGFVPSQSFKFTLSEIFSLIFTRVSDQLSEPRHQLPEVHGEEALGLHLQLPSGTSCALGCHLI